MADDTVFGVYSLRGVCLAIFDTLDDLAAALDTRETEFYTKWRMNNDGPYRNGFVIKAGARYTAPHSKVIAVSPVSREAPCGRIEAQGAEYGMMKRRLESGLRDILLAPDITEADMPTLQGSEKQIAWAAQIRAKLAKANPLHPLLRSEAAAKVWIDCRETIPVYPEARFETARQ